MDGKCEWNFLYKSQGNYAGLPIHKCKACSLQALFPRPEAKSLYTEGYFTSKAEYSYKDERRTFQNHAHVWDARIQNIRRFQKKGRFLDVGSSFGGFLERAKHFGFEVQGVEISEYAANYANSRGIPTFPGSLLEAKFPSESFDVITLIEVIEHLENPKIVFSELARLLRPGGLLVLQTANFEGWQAIREKEFYHYYMPGHFYYYSHSLLEKILKIQGFSRFQPYFGVDFPLLAKLKKSRGQFRTIWDYRQWFRISYYHFLSFLKKDGKPRTSSYVLYAFKNLG